MDEEERKGFLGGSMIVTVLFVMLMSLVGCAASQGHHRHDESCGYHARPGNGSAHAGHVGDACVVSGTTTKPERSIEAVSAAGEFDALAGVIRTRAEPPLECYRQHGSLCSIYPYSRHYTYPSHTRRVVGAVDAWRAKRAAEEARRRADAALRGARSAARLSLETANELERVREQGEPQ